MSSKEPTTRIAIDYDGTYTADPELWNAFIALAQSRGHEVVCVTGRGTRMFMTLPESVPIVLARDEYKRDVLYRERGQQRTIWIDDMPGTIELPRKLIWEDQ